MNNMNNMGMNNMNNMGMNNMNNMGMNNMNNNMGMNNMNNMGMNNCMNLMGMMNYMNTMGLMGNMNCNFGQYNMPMNMNQNQMNNNLMKNITGQMNFNQNNGAISTGGKEPPPEVIPRVEQSISADFYQNITNKMNLIMNASSGLTLIMPTPHNTPIKTFLRNYIKKLGLGEGVLGSSIIFLFNAEIIDVNDDKPVSFFPDNASITVIDVGNVIGA